MQYRHKFINHYLCIKVYTNSKRISQLINNFLDFDNTHCANPKIKINFYLNETNLKNRDDNERFVYQRWLKKDKNLQFSIGSTIASITADPETSVVKGDIFHFNEPLKERLLYLIFTQPLHFILAHHHLFFLHASVVCQDNNCILIIGDQDAGKSTLALVLSRNGFNLLADDDCFIKPMGSGVALYPFSTKMGLKDKILDRYPELKKHTLKNYRYGGKHRFSLNSIAPGSNYFQTRKCKMIIFPRYREKGEAHLKEISKKRALDSFGNSSIPYPKKQAQKMFWTLSSLIREANTFELTYNDEQLDKIPKMIRKNFCL